LFFRPKKVIFFYLERSSRISYLFFIFLKKNLSYLTFICLLSFKRKILSYLFICLSSSKRKNLSYLIFLSVFHLLKEKTYLIFFWSVWNIFTRKILSSSVLSTNNLNCPKTCCARNLNCPLSLSYSIWSARALAKKVFFRNYLSFWICVPDVKRHNFWLRCSLLFNFDFDLRIFYLDFCNVYFLLL